MTLGTFFKWMFAILVSVALAIIGIIYWKEILQFVLSVLLTLYIYAHLYPRAAILVIIAVIITCVFLYKRRKRRKAASDPNIIPLEPLD